MYRSLVNRLRNGKKQEEGFTLVELLVVIGIIVVLFSVILVAIDPARRLNQARDAVRRQDVRDILEAVQEYIVDNDGTTPAAIDSVTGTYQVIGTDTSGCSTTCGLSGTETTSCADLTAELVSGTVSYLASMPADPSTGDAGNTDYAINQTSSGHIVVAACDPEVATSISVER
jgi:type IV pilus assembly protein PilA